MSCHGEFKTPGGKLIAVDFDIVDGELRNVVVTGDFFLYPEEALPVLAGALEKRLRGESPDGARLLCRADRVISRSAGGSRGPRVGSLRRAGTGRSWLRLRR